MELRKRTANKAFDGYVVVEAAPKKAKQSAASNNKRNAAKSAKSVNNAATKKARRESSDTSKRSKNSNTSSKRGGKKDKKPVSESDEDYDDVADDDDEDIFEDEDEDEDEDDDEDEDEDQDENEDEDEEEEGADAAADEDGNDAESSVEKQASSFADLMHAKFNVGSPGQPVNSASVEKGDKKTSTLTVTVFLLCDKALKIVKTINDINDLFQLSKTGKVYILGAAFSGHATFQIKELLKGLSQVRKGDLNWKTSGNQSGASQSSTDAVDADTVMFRVEPSDGRKFATFYLSSTAGSPLHHHFGYNENHIWYQGCSATRLISDGAVYSERSFMINYLKALPLWVNHYHGVDSKANEAIMVKFLFRCTTEQQIGMEVIGWANGPKTVTVSPPESKYNTPIKSARES